MSYANDYLNFLFENPKQLTTNNIIRELSYNVDSNVFLDLTNVDGASPIENIYEIISPIHVELFRSKLEDIVVKGLNGDLIYISVMSSCG